MRLVFSIGRSSRMPRSNRTALKDRLNATETAYDFAYVGR
jgi:hypothetical protein